MRWDCEDKSKIEKSSLTTLTIEDNQLKSIIKRLENKTNN